MSINKKEGSNRKALAIIPARGGSVRIPRKNLADFGGQPAIAHVLKIAQDSGVFRQVAVSTDDPDIAAQAEAAGADVVWRPETLADGHTPLQPVVTHAIEALGATGTTCMILATAVLLRPELLRQADAILNKDPALEYVIGVRRYDSPPQRAITLGMDGMVAMQTPEFFNVRSQDLTPLYHDAGQFSFGRNQAWQSGRASFMSRTRAIELARDEAIDIDELEDLEFARLIFKMRHGI